MEQKKGKANGTSTKGRKMEIKADVRNKRIEEKLKLENLNLERLKIVMNAQREIERTAAEIKIKEIECKTANGARASQIENLRVKLESLQSGQKFSESLTTAPSGYQNLNLRNLEVNF